jgi:outer membrane biosynthesis protein TonB
LKEEEILKMKRNLMVFVLMLALSTFFASVAFAETPANLANPGQIAEIIKTASSSNSGDNTNPPLSNDTSTKDAAKAVEDYVHGINPAKDLDCKCDGEKNDPAPTPDPTPAPVDPAPTPTPAPAPEPAKPAPAPAPAPVKASVTSLKVTPVKVSAEGYSLPDTATPLFNYMAAGIALIAGGLSIMAIQRKRQNQAN